MNDLDLSATNGYLVADKLGRVLGRVEHPIYGAPDIADALSVRRRRFSRRRRVVPAEAVERIDGTAGIVALRMDQESVQSFL